jgi:hypothetical protein
VVSLCLPFSLHSVSAFLLPLSAYLLPLYFFLLTMFALPPPLVCLLPIPLSAFFLFCLSSYSCTCVLCVHSSSLCLPSSLSSIYSLCLRSSSLYLPSSHCVFLLPFLQSTHCAFLLLSFVFLLITVPSLFLPLSSF